MIFTSVIMHIALMYNTTGRAHRVNASLKALEETIKNDGKRSHKRDKMHAFSQDHLAVDLAKMMQNSSEDSHGHFFVLLREPTGFPVSTIEMILVFAIAFLVLYYNQQTFLKFYKQQKKFSSELGFVSPR